MIKDKLQQYLIIALLILLGLCIYLCYTIFQKNKIIQQQEIVYKQNEFSKQELERLKKDSSTIYHKYVEVSNIVDRKNKVLKENGEKIVTLNNKIISINKIVDSLNGRIVVIPGRIDTTKIPVFLIGRKYAFDKVRDFYTLKDTVTLGNPPKNNFNLFFYQNIGQTDYLTINKNGIFSGYSKFTPEFINNYLTINKMNIVIEKDEFYPLLQLPKSYEFFLDGGLVISDKTNFAIGGSIIKNEKWKVGYQKVINNNIHLINFGWNFYTIK